MSTRPVAPIIQAVSAASIFEPCAKAGVVAAMMIAAGARRRNACFIVISPNAIFDF
jgi:hypothetical protein